MSNKQAIKISVIIFISILLLIFLYLLFKYQQCAKYSGVSGVLRMEKNECEINECNKIITGHYNQDVNKYGFDAGGYYFKCVPKWYPNSIE